MIITHKLAWDKCLSHKIFPLIEKGWKDEQRNIHFFWGLAGKNIREIAECEEKKEGWGVDYVRLTYKRWFQEGKEPAVETNISEICNELKIDKDKAIEKANTEELEKEYLTNTDNARKNKVFGSPSFIVKNEIFWGDDRMEDSISWSKK